METASFNGTYRPRTRLQWKKFDQSKQQKIVLFSKRLAKRFLVFSDNEVGIMKRFQNRLNTARADEDNSSSDEVVQWGTQRSVNIITKFIKETRSKRSQSDEKCSLSWKSITSKRSFSTNAKSDH